MSDYANNLLKAIKSGEQASMDDAFNSAINAKIADALDAKKIEIAKGMYGIAQVPSEESDEQIETSDEHGTEEV